MRTDRTNATEPQPCIDCDSQPLCCPICKDTYCHIMSVEVNQRGVIATVERQGVSLKPDGPKSGRGSVVRVRFACESGHSFTMALRFHKGMVYPQWLDETGGVPDLANELWRD